MKAKEYAQEYKQGLSFGMNPEHILSEILLKFNSEISDEIEKRGLKSDSSIFSLLDELEIKWKSFIRQIDSPVLEKGFYAMLGEIYPDVCARWEIYREVIRDKAHRVRSERNKKTSPLVRGASARRGIHGGIRK